MDYIAKKKKKKNVSCNETEDDQRNELETLTCKIAGDFCFSVDGNIVDQSHLSLTHSFFCQSGLSVRFDQLSALLSSRNPTFSDLVLLVLLNIDAGHEFELL